MGQSVTLSWKLTYSTQESSQSRKVVFSRYPQHNNSAVLRIEEIGVVNVPIVGVIPFSNSPLAPRIAVREQDSASVTELNITIQNITKQDEAFYWIEVNIGGTVVANQTIFLTGFGKYVHFTCCACIDIPRSLEEKIVTRSLEGVSIAPPSLPPFYFRHNSSDWHETWYIY